MTAFGFALIVCGLAVISGSVAFRVFSEPSSTDEALEESLECTEHHLEEMRGERGERGQISGHPIRSRRSPAPR
jgi:hypothetical protein